MPTSLQRKCIPLSFVEMLLPFFCLQSMHENKTSKQTRRVRMFSQLCSLCGHVVEDASSLVRRCHLDHTELANI